MSAGPWLWVATTLGFSPLLLDLGAHAAAEPWARYASLFVPLTALVLATARRGPPRFDGLALLGAGVAWELVAIALRSLPLGRPALVLAIIGLCRLQGIGSWPQRLLAAWLVPVPMLLQQPVSPATEQLWLAGAIALVPDPLLVEGSLVTATSGSLFLDAPDGGLPLAALLSGFAWAAAAGRGLGLVGCGLWALAGAALAIPSQFGVVWGAVGLLALGAPGAAGWLLAPGGWMLAALAASLFLRRR